MRLSSKNWQHLLETRNALEQQFGGTYFICMGSWLDGTISIFLVVVDYVSKAIPSQPCDSKTVIKLFKKIIFPRFGIPILVISDGGSHFIEKQFENLLKKYGVSHKLLHHIILRPVDREKIQTGRWRIFWKIYLEDKEGGCFGAWWWILSILNRI